MRELAKASDSAQLAFFLHVCANSELDSSIPTYLPNSPSITLLLIMVYATPLLCAMFALRNPISLSLAFSYRHGMTIRCPAL